MLHFFSALRISIAFFIISSSSSKSQLYHSIIDHSNFDFQSAISGIIKFASGSTVSFS